MYNIYLLIIDVVAYYLVHCNTTEQNNYNVTHNINCNKFSIAIFIYTRLHVDFSARTSLLKMDSEADAAPFHLYASIALLLFSACHKCVPTVYPTNNPVKV